MLKLRPTLPLGAIGFGLDGVQAGKVARMKKLIEKIYWWFWKRNEVKVNPVFHIRNVMANRWFEYLGGK